MTTGPGGAVLVIAARDGAAAAAARNDAPCRRTGGAAGSEAAAGWTRRRLVAVLATGLLPAPARGIVSVTDGRWAATLCRATLTVRLIFGAELCGPCDAFGALAVFPALWPSSA
jgi:hypothetical protein